jgi:hypothetical protein
MSTPFSHLVLQLPSSSSPSSPSDSSSVVVRISLSRCIADKRLIPPIHKLIEYVSKLRVICTLCLKIWLSRCTRRQDLHLDQNFISAMFTLLRKNANSSTRGRKSSKVHPGLAEAVDEFKIRHGDILPLPPDGMPSTAISKACSYAATQLLTNHENHLKKHSIRCVDVWFRNECTLFEEDDNKLKDLSRLLYQPNDHQLSEDHLPFREQIVHALNVAQRAKTEIEHSLNTKSFDAILWRLLSLRRTSERLPSQNRVKTLALIPEAKISMSFTRLDTISMGYLLNMTRIWNGPSQQVQQHHDVIWNSFLDTKLLSKLKKLPLNKSSFLTDGITAAFEFQKKMPRTIFPTKVDPAPLSSLKKGFLCLRVKYT